MSIVYARITFLAETGEMAEDDGPGHCVHRLIPGSYAAVSCW